MDAGNYECHIMAILFTEYVNAQNNISTRKRESEKKPTDSDFSNHLR